MAEVDFGSIDGGLGLGSYVGIVKGINYQTDEKKGTMLASFSVIIDGTERRTKLYNLEGKGLFYLYQALLAMGVDVPKGKVELDSLPIEGLKAEFSNSERESTNGKTYRQLEPVKPLGKASDAERLQLTEKAPF
jgi:hypothetical protein